MNKYANELKEVYVILNTLEDEDYNKIPKITMQAIEENMNDEYVYELDDNIELKDNPMLEGTKEFLFNIFRDYLATEQQRQKIKIMQAKDRAMLEEEKHEQYNNYLFENINKTDKTMNKIQHENLQLIEYKKNIFVKIFEIIKNIFRRK